MILEFSAWEGVAVSCAGVPPKRAASRLLGVFMRDALAPFSNVKVRREVCSVFCAWRPSRPLPWSLDFYR
jgi:hypothetical protein